MLYYYYDLHNIIMILKCYDSLKIRIIIPTIIMNNNMILYTMKMVLQNGKYPRNDYIII